MSSSHYATSQPIRIVNQKMSTFQPELYTNAAQAAAYSASSSSSAGSAESSNAPTTPGEAIMLPTASKGGVTASKMSMLPPQSSTAPAPAKGAKATKASAAATAKKERAKPGRKRSEEEPATKRQAQNRASQRAFRERKQNYLASLEQKVASYEEQLNIEPRTEFDGSAPVGFVLGAPMAVGSGAPQSNAAELERVRQENTQLRDEGAALRARCDALERELASAGAALAAAAAAGNAASAAASRNGKGRQLDEVGCKAPDHEGVGTRSKGRQKRPLPSRSTPSSSATAFTLTHNDVTHPLSAGRDDFERRTQRDTMSPLSSDDSARLRSLSIGEAAAAGTQGGADDNMSYHAQQPSLNGGSQDMALSLFTNADQNGMLTPSPPSMFSANRPYAAAGGGNSFKSPGSYLLPSADVNMDRDRDCGFCTDQSPCLCLGEAVLDLSGGDGKDAMDLDATDVPQSRGCGGKKDVVNALSVGSMLASGPSAPLRRLGGKPKLWAVTSSNAHAAGKPRLWATTTSSSPLSATFSASTSQTPVFRLRTVDASQAQANMCSGDPRSCAACSEDPALAAFCEAVSQNASGAGNGPTILDAGNALPLRRQRSRPVLAHSHTFSHTPSRKEPLWPIERTAYASVSAPGLPLPRPVNGIDDRQSIPDAWRQISSHPRFNSWDGGLSLLADVVSGRSAPAPSPRRATSSRYLPSASRGERRPSVEIDSQGLRSLARGQESSARGGEDDEASRTMVPFSTLRESAARAGITSASASASDDAMDVASIASTEEGGPSKRRRLYVDKDRVEQALAMLDRGGAPPCPCPWSK